MILTGFATPLVSESISGTLDQSSTSPSTGRIDLISQSPSEIWLKFQCESPSLNPPGDITDASQADFDETEYLTLTSGYRIPITTRYLLIPPTGELGYSIQTIQSQELASDYSGATDVTDIFECDDLYQLQKNSPTNNLDRFWPPNPVEISPPAIIRGYRLVRVTYFPLQYDLVNKNFVANTGMEISVKFSGTGLNEISNPNKKRPSRNLARILRSVVINPPDELTRDDDFAEGSIVYVIGPWNNVENALQPVLEWRRRSGRKAEVIRVGNRAAANEIKAAILEAYNEWDTPPEAVIICGGGSNNTEFFLGSTDNRHGAPYQYETDHPYACLEGDDELPEIAVGRFPIENLQQLNGMVAKIVQYESDPYIGENAAADWQLRAAFAATDPRSGRSTIDVCKWSESLLRRNGYEDFAEFFFQNNQAVNPTDFIRQRIHIGFNVFAYRGWMQMSGYRPENINDYQNEGMLPLVILATCNTGDFADHFWGTSWTERFFQNSHGGAIGAIGTAGATSTQYNNMMISGTLRSIFSLGVKSQGWALMGAKLDLYQNYANRGDRNHPEMQDVENWLASTWIYNLMGDPSTELFTDVPQGLTVEHEQGLSVGQTSLTVQVHFAEGEDVPVEGARLCLYAPDAMQIVGFSDEQGQVRLIFEPLPNDIDEVMLTITGDNLKPYLTDLEVNQPEASIGFANVVVDDQGDGNANPGEQLELITNIENFGDVRPDGQLTATLETDDELIIIAAGQRIIEQAPEPGEQAEARFLVELSPQVQHNSNALFRLIVESADDSWVSSFSFPVLGAKFELDSLYWEDQPLRPGEFADLAIQIKNIGAIASDRLEAELFSRQMGVMVTEPNGRFNIMEPGEVVLSDDLFELTVAVNAPAGGLIDLGMALSSEDGFVDTIYFQANLAEAMENEAFGPDGYGYICIDNTDTLFWNYPEYEWIDITQVGDILDLHDVRPESDASLAIELPFEFQYYGERFDRITVNTNGWIAMGDQSDVTSGRNQNIPGGMVSSGMICPFWDDLISQDDGEGVYTWFDEENHRFVVEWYNMRKLVPQGGPFMETFEVILFDSEFHPTLTGDGDIVFQYSDVVDDRTCYESWDTPYATVGIGSGDQTDGIVYSYWGTLNPGAAPLEDGRAILFSTFAAFEVGRIEGRVTDLATNAPLADAMVRTNFGFVTFTDDQGNYVLQQVAANILHMVTAKKAGYNDSTQGEFEILVDDAIRVDFALRHPEFAPSMDRFVVEVDSGDVHVFDAHIANTGNGPLLWEGRTKLVGDRDAEPWDYRMSYPVGELTDDNRIEGAVFLHGYFYISGANGNDDNLIYKMTPDGEVIDSFAQVNSSRYGYKDMDSDGNWIWACGADSIYALNELGEVMARWDDPNRPSQYIACDSEQGKVFVAGTTTDIIQCDFEGNEVGPSLNRTGMRIYGLGFFPEDPDGYELYIMDHTSDGLKARLMKMNVMTGDTMIVRDLPLRENSVGLQGIYIDRTWDSYNWTLMTIENLQSDAGGDRLTIFQVTGRDEWMMLSPTSGEVEPGGEGNFSLTLNSAALPDDIWRGEIEFTHNAEGGVTLLPIELWVGVGGTGVELNPIPMTLEFTSIYPNPFNSSTSLNIVLPVKGKMTLAIYDLQGRLVERMLSISELEPGRHTIRWGSETAGVYFAVLEQTISGNKVERRVRKLICLP